MKRSKIPFIEAQMALFEKSTLIQRFVKEDNSKKVKISFIVVSYSPSNPNTYKLWWRLDNNFDIPNGKKDIKKEE